MQATMAVGRGSLWNPHARVILRDSILKDLARTATHRVAIYTSCALDPSQAQDDSITRSGLKQKWAIRFR
jgi:hypothetical protein